MTNSHNSFCRSWLSVWKATDRRLGQHKLANHFIQNFYQMFDLLNLIKWEVAQSSYRLMEWISRADEILQSRAANPHLWHLLQGRIDNLRELNERNGGYVRPWLAVDTRTTALNDDTDLNNDDKVCLCSVIMAAILLRMPRIDF